MSENKLAVITGASAGIGKQLAHQMAAKGYNLMLIARRQNLLKELKEEIESKHKVKVDYAICDLSKQAEYMELAKKLAEHKIDYFFNNAGVGYFGMFAQQDPSRIDDMLLLNVNSLVFLTNTICKQMAAHGGGTIVNVSSIAALSKYAPGTAVYAATKKLVYDLSRAIQFENEKLNNNVRVVALQPGAIKTEWQQNAQPQKGREFKHSDMYQEADEFVAKVLEMIFAGQNVITYGPMATSRKMLRMLPAKMAANRNYRLTQSRMKMSQPNPDAK